MQHNPALRPAAAILALLAASACVGSNRGLDTVHQPVVSQGPQGATAVVPGCPDWSRPSQPEFGASTTSDFGCAVKSNLAAMVADPMDLVRAKEGGGTDAFVAQKAIRSWRDMPSTARQGLEKIEVGAPK